MRRYNTVIYGYCVRQMASELFVQISIRKAEARLLNRDNVSTSSRIIVTKLFTYVFAKEKHCGLRYHTFWLCTYFVRNLFSLRLIELSYIMFYFAIFRFDNFCELLQKKMRIENMAIKSTIDAMLKNGELEEIIENGRIKLRATHQDI